MGDSRVTASSVSFDPHFLEKLNENQLPVAYRVAGDARCHVLAYDEPVAKFQCD